VTVSESFVSAQEPTATYVCRFPDCTAIVNGSRGLAAYCPAHRPERKPRPERAGGAAEQLRALTRLARDVDRLEARARALTADALAAKERADAKRDEFRQAIAELADPEGR